MDFPKLDNIFFAVCQTAIKNTAWKYGDFEAVKRAEGQLEALRLYALEQNTPAQEPIVEVPKHETTKAPEVAETTQLEAPVAPEAKVEAKTEGILSPDEAKKAPVRKMPDEILEAVTDAMEIAKNPPKVANVKVEALSSDPDEARNQFNKNF